MKIKQCFPVRPKLSAGIENIDHRRFKLRCLVCNHKLGACIQCARGQCQASFHIECARRAKIYMEMGAGSGKRYLLYCEKHAPLKIKRVIESRLKGMQEQIAKFCRVIEKYYISYRYRFEEIPANELDRIQKKEKKRKKKEKKKLINTRDKFLREIKFQLQKHVGYGNIWELKKSDLINMENEEETKTLQTYTFNNFYRSQKNPFESNVSKSHPVWVSMSRSKGWKVSSMIEKYRRLMNGAMEDSYEGLVYKKNKLKQIEKMQRLTHQFGPKKYTLEQNILFVPNQEGTLNLN